MHYSRLRSPHPHNAPTPEEDYSIVTKDTKDTKEYEIIETEIKYP